MVIGCAVAGVCSTALAQEAMYTAAATMPGPGIMVLREQLHYYRYGSSALQNVEKTGLLQFETSLQIGLMPELSLTLDAPVEVRETDTLTQPPSGEWDTGVSDFDVMFKWRFWRDDTGGIDTTRAALLAGARVDTDGRSNIDPHLGVVLTRVMGRHGINLEAHYTMTTGGVSDRLDNLGGEGSADAFRYNASYVYRIEPAAYTSTSTGAWYITAEVNGLMETNGDHEMRFSPGLMYEGRRIGLEFMAQFPLWNHLESRGELDWAVGVGVRFLF